MSSATSAPQSTPSQPSDKLQSTIDRGVSYLTQLQQQQPATLAADATSSSQAEDITPTSHRLTLPRTGVRLHYIRCGPPPSSPSCRGVLLFIHGWPDHWFGWRYQIAYFSRLGYYCLAPDQRGFGGTELLEGNKEIVAHKFSWQLSCKDLQQLCQAEGVKRVVAIGHDWGGAVAWSFCRRYTSLCCGVISLCTPYRPAKSSYISLEDVTKIMPVFQYQLYFAHERLKAAKELSAQPERTLDSLFRKGDKSEMVGGLMDSKGTSFFQNMPKVIKPSKLLTQGERQIYCETFAYPHAFEQSLCWYGNSYENWREEGWQWRDAADEEEKQDQTKSVVIFDIKNKEVQQWYTHHHEKSPPSHLIRPLSSHISTPALMVTAGADFVLKPSMSVGMEEWCSVLQRCHVEGAAHWVQQEKPQQVNEGIRKFLETLPRFENRPVTTLTTAKLKSKL